MTPDSLTYFDLGIQRLPGATQSHPSAAGGSSDIPAGATGLLWAVCASAATETRPSPRGRDLPAGADTAARSLSGPRADRAAAITVW